MELDNIEKLTNVNGYSVYHYEGSKSLGVPLGNVIAIDHETNSISFRLQRGNPKTIGVNGCTPKEVLMAMRELIVRSVPFGKRHDALRHLSGAIEELEEEMK